MNVIQLQKGSFNKDKLLFLREINGYTLSEVADGIGKKQPFISQLEHDKSKPSFNTILDLASFFGVKHTFFLNNDSLLDSEGAVFYRKKMAVPKKKWRQSERKNIFYAYFENKISDLLNLPRFVMPDYAHTNKKFELISYEDIELIANRVREHFDLGNGPISNMTLLVEKLGIRIHFVDFSSQEIDALTEKIRDNYYIAINKERTASVRIRYNIAHELGHILLHSGYPTETVQNVNNHKRIEAEAQYFAGALLMPEEGLALDMAYNNMEFLKELKLHWKVSLQALIYRGKEIGLIPEHQALYLRQTIARKKWRKYEPLDDIIPIEFPTFLNSALTFSGIDTNQLLRKLSDTTGIFDDNIIETLGFTQFHEKNKKPNLKLL